MGGGGMAELSSDADVPCWGLSLSGLPMRVNERGSRDGRRLRRRVQKVVVRAAPQEEVVGIGRKAAVLKQAQEVMELPVDVANELQRRLQLEERRLIAEV